MGRIVRDWHRHVISNREMLDPPDVARPDVSAGSAGAAARGEPGRYARRNQPGFQQVAIIRRAIQWLVIAVAIAFAVCAHAQTPGRQLLRGYIAVAPTAKPIDNPDGPARGLGPDVYLPNVEVVARNLSTNEVIGPAVTDLSGRFTLPVVAPGRYEICWKARGFPDGCSKAPASVSNHMQNVSTIRIAQPPANKNTVVVFGKVHFRNGSRTRFFEPHANINAFARVTLLDGAGKTLDEVYVNNFDTYVLPAVPVNDEVVIRATIDKGVVEQRIFHRLPGPTALGGAPVHSIDLAIENVPPRLEPLVPLDGGGRRVKVAKPGAKLELIARADDPDGDPLRYTWLPSEGSGSLSALSGQKVAWSLPNHPGLYSVSLFADDGKGGYATSSLAVRTDDLGIPFSGRVIDTAGTLVPGAVVDINGQLAVTGALGTFTVRIKDAPLFVMNIRKPGYTLNSNTYDNGVTGGQWTLGRASVTSVNPRLPINLTHERSQRDCPGPASSRLNVKAFPKLATPQYQDGKGNVVLPFGDGKLPTQFRVPPGCGPAIRVEIPANALVDAAGNPPSGNVDIALSTVDLLSPEQMPGDYTAISGTDTKVMQSFGAGSVEISAGGRRYNLKSGARARVTIPVDRSQIAAGAPLAPTIPLLFFDERAGLWREDGQAILAGKAYVADVRHFSYINADTLKTDQACVRIFSPSLPANYNLEAWIPQTGGAAPKVFNQPIDNSLQTEHVIFNLPLNTNIVLIPLRQNDATPIGTFVVNTGQAQNPTTPNHPAGPHYDACATQVTFTEQALPDEPLSGEFLQGLFSFEATNLNELDSADPGQTALKDALNQTTLNYYAQIDPPGPGAPPAPGRRATFGGFKSLNGFGGPGELHGIYANSGDLGFGRDMHCTSQAASDGQTDYACYVTNYGNILTSDSQDAADAVANHNPVATVAMEYARIEDPGVEPPTFTDGERVVKFLVYNGNLDSSTLINAADLDSGLNIRQRPVPQLCMVCHGGEYPNPPTGLPIPGHLPAPGFNTAADVKLGAHFLPFDLHYYTFAGGNPDKQGQQPVFKTMNETIVRNAPAEATPVIGEVITKMYAGGPQQDETFKVSGWQNAPNQPLKEQVYQNVVARACRTCHIANPDPALHFNQAQQFIDKLGSIEQRVCVQHVMPHAKVTHKIFWGVPLTPPPTPEASKVAALQLFGDAFKTASNGWQGNVCGTFVAGGITPKTPFELTILPIFSNKGVCTGCHVGASAPKGLALDAPHAWDQLVNIPSVELSTMKRVQPGNTAQSYMYHKIFGDQAMVNGCCSQMPIGAPQLSAIDLLNIQNWITSGAPK